MQHRTIFNAYFFLLSRYIPHISLYAESQTLRHSFPSKHFRSLFSTEFSRHWVAELYALIDSLPERGNENIKYFIYSSRNRTHNLWRLQLHACAPAPQLKSHIILINYIKFISSYFIQKTKSKQMKLVTSFIIKFSQEIKTSKIIPEILKSRSKMLNRNNNLLEWFQLWFRRGGPFVRQSEYI